MTAIYDKVKKLFNAYNNDDVDGYEIDEDGSAEEMLFNEEISYETKHVLNDILRDNSISYKCITQHGGEDMGSDYYYIYEFTDNKTNETCIIKLQGWYASYHGADFEEMFEAKKEYETITVYNRL